MFEDIRKQFFPMQLPTGVVACLVDEVTAQRTGEITQIFSPEALGHFRAPESRQERLGRLRKLLARSASEWIVFYSQKDEPVGWFWGYMEYETTFTMDTIGLIPEFRNRGIYSAFLKQLIPYLDALGYERLTSYHHPNNRAVLIANLKAGFNIVGMEVNESNGAMVKMAYLFHADRRKYFEQVFMLAPDQTSDD